MLAREVFITCAVTGSADSVRKNPNVPVTPSQIAASALEAHAAGAAIVHLHVRDPKSGMASRDPALFREVVDRISSEIRGDSELDGRNGRRSCVRAGKCPARTSRRHGFRRSAGTYGRTFSTYCRKSAASIAVRSISMSSCTAPHPASCAPWRASTNRERAAGVGSIRTRPHRTRQTTPRRKGSSISPLCSNFASASSTALRRPPRR